MLSTTATEKKTPWKSSVFWKVAGLFVGAQVITGAVAVMLSAWFAVNQSYALVENSLRLRLEEAAREIEEQVSFDPDSNLVIPRILRYDLEARFPDPILILDRNGQVLTETAEDDFFDFGVDPDEDPDVPFEIPEVPADASVAIESRQMQIKLDQNASDRNDTWAAVPFYTAVGTYMGSFLLTPLEFTIDQELTGARSAFTKALIYVLLFGGFSALILGGLLTWRLVRPLQRMTRRVEQIGQGNYEVRIQTTGSDELGRLGEAINQMAMDVEKSILTLRAANQLRRELVANVGHDLRTPLASVYGHLEEADRFTKEGRYEDATDSIRSAQNQSTYLKRLVNDLFELSVLEGEQPGLRLEPVPVAELINEVARNFVNPMKNSGIRFSTQIQPELPIVRADGVRLMRILNNLLGNARRYTPEGGEVVLSASTHSNELLVSVRDSGPGIPPDNLERVFQRYFRGEDSRTRDGGEGTGLGLSISRAIAEAHGGTLTAESEVGKGSVFRFRMPLEPDDQGEFS